MKRVLVSALLAMTLVGGVAAAATLPGVSMNAGDSVAVTCNGTLSTHNKTTTSVTAKCASPKPTPSPSPSVSPSPSPSPSPTTPGCSGVAVPAGTSGSLQSAIDAQPTGTTFCLAAGTFTISNTVNPKSGDTLVGASRAGTVLNGGTSFYFDGQGVTSSGVTLRHMTLTGAGDTDVRTGDNWTLDDVRTTAAGTDGVRLIGSGVTMTGSETDHNGRYGIEANFSTNLHVTNTEIDNNDTAGYSSTDDAGADKFVKTTGLVLNGLRSHDNNGVGIWLDIDNQGFTVENSTVTGERDTYGIADGIRIEISCGGTVSGNTVTQTANVSGIEVENSHDVNVTSNTVNGDAGALYGVRVIAEARQSGTDAPCGDVTHAATNDTVSGNTISMAGGVNTGLVGVGAVSVAGDTFDGNTYHASCGSQQWTRWNGSSNPTMTFAQWRASGFGATGSCST